MKGIGKTNGKLSVSDHALVRYLERVKGIDIEALKAQMLHRGVALWYERLGDGVYPVDSYRLVIKNATVVTCLEKKRRVS